MFDAYLKQSFLMVLLFSGIPLILSSLVGLAVAVVQASTQIQEQTITYVSKLAVVSVCLALMAHWCAGNLIEFMQQLLGGIGHLGRMP